MRGVGIQNRRKKSGHIYALAGKICRQTARALLMGVLIFTGLFICSPVLLLLSGSMTGEYELTQAFKSVLSGGSGFINWTVLPEFPTLGNRRLLFILPVFYPVLEFYQNGAHHPGGPDGDSGAGGMGLCGLQISFPQAFVYPVYCFNADTISGDHAVLISGAGPAASYGYAGCRHTSCHFFHFPCVSDLQRVRIHPGCWRPEG